MDLKSRLQRMLQIVEDAERVGALADIERDILLTELREAYAELKFGQTENVEPKTENEEVKPVVEEPEEEVEDAEPEVEVELIFDEEEQTEEEQIEEEPVVEEPAVEEPAVEEPAEEPAAEEPAEEEVPIVPITPIEEPIEKPIEEAPVSKPISINALYEEGPVSVVGEQFRDAPAVADVISCPKSVAVSARVESLRSAIGLADKFMIIRELFADDAEAFEAAIDALESQSSFDDCVIYISENYSWSPNAESTKLIMDLLNRKHN